MRENSVRIYISHYFIFLINSMCIFNSKCTYGLYDMPITHTGNESEIDEDPITKKTGDYVYVPCNKKLVSYASLGLVPQVNEYVIVHYHTKLIWGKVIARNHYVFVVKTSKHGGSYYTEYNMYKRVSK